MRLLQEPITFPCKISQTFHESHQSNTAIVNSLNFLRLSSANFCMQTGNTQLSMEFVYHKNSKIETSRVITTCITILKGNSLFYKTAIHPKDTDGNADSVGPDETAI